jgi:hypothetical protein
MASFGCKYFKTVWKNFNFTSILIIKLSRNKRFLSMNFIICLMIYNHVNYVFAFCTTSVYAIRLKNNVQEIELFLLGQQLESIMFKISHTFFSRKNNPWLELKGYSIVLTETHISNRRTALTNSPSVLYNCKNSLHWFVSVHWFGGYHHATC